VYHTKTVHSPLHDNKQTLPALIEVLIDINDAHNVGTGRSPPVQLHFPTGLGTILQHLDRRSETRRVRPVNIKYKQINYKIYCKLPRLLICPFASHNNYWVKDR